MDDDENITDGGQRFPKERGGEARLSRHDQRLVDWRLAYQSMSADEKKAAREWLKQIDALHDNCPFDHWKLVVKFEVDECDAEGETTAWHDGKFHASTMLEAMDAWDKGETYTPAWAGWPVE